MEAVGTIGNAVRKTWACCNWVADTLAFRLKFPCKKRCEVTPETALYRTFRYTLMFVTFVTLLMIVVGPPL